VKGQNDANLEFDFFGSRCSGVHGLAAFFWAFLAPAQKRKSFLVFGAIAWFLFAGALGYVARCLTEPGKSTIQESFKQTALQGLLYRADIYKCLPADTDLSRVQVFVKAFPKGTRRIESVITDISHWPQGLVTPAFTVDIFIHDDDQWKDRIMHIGAFVQVRSPDQFERHLSYSRELWESDEVRFDPLREGVCVPKIFWRLVRAGMIT
jgi:hypothetical protein